MSSTDHGIVIAEARFWITGARRRPWLNCEQTCAEGLHARLTGSSGLDIRTDNTQSGAPKWSSGNRALHVAAWCVVGITFLNTLLFVLHSANPTLMADDWYFFHVFGSKALDHTLTLGDFFGRRNGPDHAEPLIKLAILWCVTKFKLDLSVEAVIGAFVALLYALLLHSVISRSVRGGPDWAKLLAWVTVAAVLLSLNSMVLWSWAENSMQYSSDILMPLFLWVAWCSCRQQRYWLLLVVTFAMAVVGDDNAIICAIAALIAFSLHFALRREERRHSAMIAMGIIVAVMIAVRIGYHFAPRLGGTAVSPLQGINGLLEQVAAGHWRAWIDAPITWGVISRNVFSDDHSHWFILFRGAVFLGMIAAEVWFWIRTVRFKWSALTFISVGLMLVSYGWIAGILIYRAPVFGTEAFNQPRYVRLYEFQVIALALMWLGAVVDGTQASRRTRWLSMTGALACLVVVVLQVPISISAWRTVPYIRAYYQTQAQQTYLLSLNPADPDVLAHCNQQLQLCGMPVHERSELVGILRSRRVGIFSPSVIAAHSMLLPAMSVLSEPDRGALLSGASAGGHDARWERRYAKLRAVAIRDDPTRPAPHIDVAKLRSSEVPLVLQGCYPSDGGGELVSSWCGPNIAAVLKEPEQLGGLEVQGWFPWSLYAKSGRSAPVDVVVAVNGMDVGHSSFSSDQLFKIAVEPRALRQVSAPHGLLFVNISVNGSFVPSHFSASSDSRVLALKISSIEALPARASPTPERAVGQP